MGTKSVEWKKPTKTRQENLANHHRDYDKSSLLSKRISNNSRLISFFSRSISSIYCTRTVSLSLFFFPVFRTVRLTSGMTFLFLVSFCVCVHVCVCVCAVSFAADSLSFSLLPPTTHHFTLLSTFIFLFLSGTVCFTCFHGCLGKWIAQYETHQKKIITKSTNIRPNLLGYNFHVY